MTLDTSLDLSKIICARMSTLPKVKKNSASSRRMAQQRHICVNAGDWPKIAPKMYYITPRTRQLWRQSIRRLSCKLTCTPNATKSKHCSRRPKQWKKKPTSSLAKSPMKTSSTKHSNVKSPSLYCHLNISLNHGITLARKL